MLINIHTRTHTHTHRQTRLGEADSSTHPRMCECSASRLSILYPSFHPFKGILKIIMIRIINRDEGRDDDEDDDDYKTLTTKPSNCNFFSRTVE